MRRTGLQKLPVALCDHPTQSHERHAQALAQLAQQSDLPRLLAEEQNLRPLQAYLPVAPVLVVEAEVAVVKQPPLLGAHV